MKMNLIEIEGFLRGKCLPGDMLVNETNAQYLVRKFAEADAKFAELAAENAGLKAAAEFSTAPDMWEELGGNVMRYQYQEWYADKLKSAIQTPATDAFLAEVRAQGVEMFAQRLRGEAEITKACTFKPVQQFEEFAARADECAANLRQDANTAEMVSAGIITKVGK